MHRFALASGTAIFGLLLFGCSSKDSPPGHEPDASADTGAGGKPPVSDSGTGGTRPLPDARPDVENPGDARPPLVCRPKVTSTIPGVTIEFSTTQCEYTLAAAKGGIVFDYRLVVERDVPGFQPPNFGYPYTENIVAGLYFNEVIAGGAENYCLCDQGLPFSQCPEPDGGTGGHMICPLITIPKGTYTRSFTWDGVNWTGPSDTGNPKGKAFPPGDYTLTISTTPGTLAKEDAGADAGHSSAKLEATFPIRLVR
jgi:hypothetical protein